MNKFMDSDAKNGASRAVLTMAVFLLTAAGAAGEQDPQRRDALFEFELYEQWLEDYSFHSLWLAPPKSLVPTPPAPSPYPALPPNPSPRP